MQINGFTKLSQDEKEQTYGGWAWLVAMLPLLMQSVVTTVASIKSIFSEKGSIKGKDISASWDDKGWAPDSKEQTTNVAYYAY